MNRLQKPGGIAALLHAAVYVVGIVVGVALIFPLLDSTPDQYLKFLAENRTVVYLWNLVAYWGSAITLVIMALALYEHLKDGSPALALTATVFGLIWAGLIIASGNLMLRDLGVVADLYGKDPAQAVTAWTALEAVENGITSGNELVGSLWLLLLSVAAWRSGRLTRALNGLGVIVGVAGILTIIPALAQPMIFGLGMVAWSVWLGIILLRRSSAQVSGHAKGETAAVAEGTAGTFGRQGAKS
jgi:hypothetical protein